MIEWICSKSLSEKKKRRFFSEFRIEATNFNVGRVSQISEENGQIQRRLDPSFGELMNLVEFFEGFVNLKKLTKTKEFVNRFAKLDVLWRWWRSKRALPARKEFSRVTTVWSKAKWYNRTHCFVRCFVECRRNRFCRLKFSIRSTWKRKLIVSFLNEPSSNESKMRCRTGVELFFLNVSLDFDLRPRKIESSRTLRWGPFGLLLSPQKILVIFVNWSWSWRKILFHRTKRIEKPFFLPPETSFCWSRRWTCFNKSWISVTIGPIRRKTLTWRSSMVTSSVMCWPLRRNN